MANLRQVNNTVKLVLSLPQIFYSLLRRLYHSVPKGDFEIPLHIRDHRPDYS